ncbi:pilus assembly protein [Mesorhizobium sp. M6A.T.Cr.TU.017.01.1.1]|uniref:TadE/TadG family type IV pilus assembly protein n=1 Tax=Mesorhizobium sp. M6A.T.Cr.TU.017.01.1.1 TaxID=2496774 RepID=UPI000FD42F27|nr:TadE/TadG family type IV pilus assembly protein [Mesorhizobium sp. M6A.T.Cr.TU.017.01.1.1]RUV02723.1 pilus assembly protein [Mesorhizobium sp. M6A.T.Cr.TU.017.01.1.1]
MNSTESKAAATECQKTLHLRIIWRLCRENSGTSAIEFALLSPIFILLLLGMVAYGIYFGASNSVQQIAADAARTAIAGLNETERQALVTSFVNNNASGYPFVDSDKLTYQAKDSTADGKQFVVSIQYDASNLPVWNLFPALPMPGSTISRKSTIRVGGI